MRKIIKNIIQTLAEFFGYEGKLTKNDFWVFVVVLIMIIVFSIMLCNTTG
jgi:uncharacterized membrane protein YhaH (DUF805 family)